MMKRKTKSQPGPRFSGAFGARLQPQLRPAGRQAAGRPSWMALGQREPTTNHLRPCHLESEWCNVSLGEAT